MALKRLSKTEVFAASGATHQGFDPILYRIVSILDENRQAKADAARPAFGAPWTPS